MAGKLREPPTPLEPLPREYGDGPSSRTSTLTLGRKRPCEGANAQSTSPKGDSMPDQASLRLCEAVADLSEVDACKADATRVDSGLREADLDRREADIYRREVRTDSREVCTDPREVST